MRKTIPLTKGLECTVDDSDYAFLSRWRWKAQTCGTKTYAARTIRSNGSKTNDITILMHREICPEFQMVDHIDGNGLNNSRGNLRPTTKKLNGANCASRKSGTSVFRGVYWNKRHKRWIAQVSGDRSKYLGGFKIEVDAAKAYDEAAIAIYGDSAVTNFMKDGTLNPKSVKLKLP